MIWGFLPEKVFRNTIQKYFSFKTQIPNMVTMIKPALPQQIEKQIRPLIENAEKFSINRDFWKAENSLLKAWALLPEPKLSWDCQPQILSRLILNCYTELQDFANAQKWMETVREAYEATEPGEDPLVDFWEAQMKFDLGLEDEAYRAFSSLYKRFKKRPFKNHDPKYLEFFLNQCKRAEV